MPTQNSGSQSEGRHKASQSVVFENKKYHSRQKFTPELEKAKVEYFKICSRMNHGLTPVEARNFTYRFAVVNNITVPRGWNEHHQASGDWLFHSKKEIKTKQ